MPAFLLPLLTGLLGAGATAGAAYAGYKGQQQTNRANLAMAREQMAFQERMSSTAAQRSTEDYRRAGLNPYLAYERTASSPGGASAVLGNEIAAGLSTAQQYRALRQEMAIAKAESIQRMGIAQTQSQADYARKSAETDAIRQSTKFNAALQPFQQRLAAAQALLEEYNIPGAANTARLESLLGTAGPGIATARNAAEVIKLIMGSRTPRTGTFITNFNRR